jgi:aspartate dehydrogenase
MEHTRSRRKIGLIGCGTIGGFIARQVDRWVEVELSAIADSDAAKAEQLAAAVTGSPRILSNEELISQVDLVVEAAGKDVVPWLIGRVIEQGKEALIMSLGGMLALSDEQWKALASYQGHIYLPSGAIAGLDAIKAASLGRLSSVTLTSRKPPAGLQGAPYLKRQGLDISSLSEPLVVFEGSAREAVAGFPQNVNVAAALSLAGLGPDRTRVRIIADPHISTNIHEIEATGDFGRITTRSENAPSPTNPKTSYLAALSAVATLTRIINPLQLGS